MSLEYYQLDDTVYFAFAGNDTSGSGGDAQSLADFKDLADTGYNPATHKLAGVVLADTCTTNTDMRGTDGANTVVPATKAEMDTAHALLATVAKQDVIDGIVDAILEDVTGLNGAAMRGTDSANTVVPATKAEMDTAHALLATVAKQDIIDTVVDAALAILKADKVIDTSQTPWELVLYTQGAAQEAGNEIFRKALSQPDGTAVTSSDHIVGQEEDPA